MGRKAGIQSRPPAGFPEPDTASPDWIPLGAAVPRPRTPLRRIAQNAAHLLGSQTVGFFMALAASVVMARTLGPTELGIFHQAQWFAGMVSVVLSLGLVTSVTKFTAQFQAQGRRGDAAAALRFILKTELALGLGATAVLLLFSARIADYSFSTREGKYFAIAFLGLTPGLQTALYSAALEGTQLFRYQSLNALTITPISLLLKIGLLLAGFGLTGILWCQVGVALLNLLFFGWAARREGLLRGGPSPAGWKSELFHYHRSILGIHFVDLLVWSRTENFFLGRFCSAAQIAYYNLALNLVTRLTGTLPALMWKILLPLATQLHGAHEDEKLARTFTHSLRYTACVLFPLITFCWVSAYELVVIFYGHAYAPAKSSFQILCLSAMLSALAQPSSAAIYASNRQRFILWFGSLLGVLNIALNLWWIPRHGAEGAAWSYSLTTSLGVLGGFVYVGWKLRLRFPWATWSKAALASLGMGLTLWWVLQYNFAAYSLFSPWQDWIQALTGRRLEMFLGARTLRVACGGLASFACYAAVLALLAKPQAEDLRLLRALARRLPWGLHRLLRPWLKPDPAPG